jgi:hypothetical protein
MKAMPSPEASAAARPRRTFSVRKLEKVSVVSKP